MDGKSMAALMIGLVLVLSGCAKNTPASMPAPAAEVKADDEKHIGHIQSVSFKSRALGREMGVDIYLPPGYSTSEKYPVLYILYGYGGNQHSWFNPLGLDRTADRLVNEGKLLPLIIVSPDYGNSFGVNTVPGQAHNPGGVDEGTYDDYLTKDLVTYIDSHYSTITSRGGRFIGGASMGGYAALTLAFLHPDLYGKVGGHSAALWNYTPSDQFTDQRDWLYPNDELRKIRDPFLLAQSRDLTSLRVYLDAGTSDMLAEQDKALFDLLQERKVPSEWHPNEGSHDMGYWQSHEEYYLLFYAGVK